MAVEESLVVSIGGDISSLNDAIQAAKDRMAEAQDAIGGLNDTLKLAEWDKFTNGAEYTTEVMKPLQAEISTTKSGVRLWTSELKAAEEELKNLQNAQSGLVGPTETAMSTQMAFNRVVRDSHSLLYNTNRGIAELTYAIPNLISKIAMAKEETGSWNSALSMASGALISWPTLLMAGGTALAMWLRSHKEAKKEVEDLSFSVENEGKVISESRGEFVKAYTEVDTLKEHIALAKQGFLDKKEVLKEYNDTIGKTVGHANNLNDAEEKLIKNADAYIKMQMYKSVANKLMDEAAKNAFEAAKKQMDAEKNLGTAAANVFKPGMSNQELEKQLGTIGKIKDATNSAIEKKGADDAAPWLKEADKMMAKAAEIAKTNGFNFFGGKEDEKNKVYADAKAKAEKIRDAYKSVIPQIQADLSGKLEGISIEEKIFGKDMSVQKINAIEEAVKKYLAVINKPVTGDNSKRAFEQLDNVKAEQNIKMLMHQLEVMKATEVIAKKLSTEMPAWAIAMGRQLEKANEDFVAFQARLIEMNKKINQYIQDAGTQIGVNFGEALGRGLNGGSFLKSFGEDLFKLVGSVLTKFGEQMIAAAGLLKAVKIAMATMQPATLLIGGIGLVALGTVMSSAAPKLATGGITTGATLAMIGEGKEREAVLPLSRLNSMINGNNQNNTGFVARTEIRGNDLGIVIDRVNRTRGRGY